MPRKPPMNTTTTSTEPAGQVERVFCLGGSFRPAHRPAGLRPPGGEQGANQRLLPVARIKIPVLHRSWRALLIAGLLGAVASSIGVSMGEAADQTYTWYGGAVNWSDGNGWTTNRPAGSNFPNNGNLGFTYDVVVTNSSVSLDLNITIEQLFLGGGQIGGGYNLTANQMFTFSGGTMAGTGTTFAVGGITIAGNADKTLSQRKLENLGSAIWSGQGALVLNNSSVITNSGTFEMQTDVTMDTANAGSFQNAGTFRKSGGSGSNTIRVAFYNSGLVNVQTGVVNFAGGGGGTAGRFQTAAGTTNAFSNGTFDMFGGVLFTNAGVTRVAGATMNLFGSATNYGTFEFASGTFGSTGSLANLGSLVITGLGDKTLTSGHTVKNEGVATWNGAGNLALYNYATFTNNGTFDVQNDAGLVGNGTGGWFQNAGVFRKSAGNGTTTITVGFNNNGLLDV
jgi:hypothetical protein